MRSCDAIITARGGSVRVPRKNLIDMAGKPLVAWSILQALETKQVTGVWVSTDDEEIAEVSRHYGAKVIMRPDWMNGSHTGGVPAVHAIKYLKECKRMDLIIHLMPITPLRLPGDLDNLIDAYKRLPEDAALKRAVFGVPRGDVAMNLDHGDGTCSSVMMEKDGQLLEYLGGVVCIDHRDYLEMYRRESEYFGEEHMTDKTLDDHIRKNVGKPLALNQTRWTAWAPLKWWQISDINTPKDVAQAREAWAAFMPKERT